MALDHLFHEPTGFYVDESDRLLGFYAGQGIATYCSSYSLDGSTCLDFIHSVGLTVMNGVTALASTRDDRRVFIQAAWDAVPSDGQLRYYDGLLHLVSLLTLSGKLRVY
jgi:hypothetical protein